MMNPQLNCQKWRFGRWFSFSNRLKRDSSSMKRWCMFSSNCGKGFLVFGGIKVKGLADCSKSASHMDGKEDARMERKTQRISYIITHSYFVWIPPKVCSPKLYPTQKKCIACSFETISRKPYPPCSSISWCTKKTKRRPEKSSIFCKWQETLSHSLSFLTSTVCSHMRSGVRVTSALGHKFLGWTPHPRMPVTTENSHNMCFLRSSLFQIAFFQTDYCMNLHFSTHCIDWEGVTCGNKQCPYTIWFYMFYHWYSGSAPCYLQ